MRLNSICVAVLVPLLAGSCLNATQAGTLSLKAGIGYDFISQEFFLDSLARTGADSLDFALKTEYLDDLKGRLQLTWSPFSDRRLEMRPGYEQTADFIRLRLLNDYRTALGAARLDLHSELDWKNRYRDSDNLDESYLYGYVKSGLAVPLTELLTSRIQLTGEAVDFDSATGFSHDHYRLGGKIGLSAAFENFSFGDFNLFAMARRVPDSTALDYLVAGAEAAFFGFWGPAELDLTSRFERKDYNREPDRDDHYRLEFSGRNKLHLGGDFFVRQDAELDLAFFSSSDPVNQNYGRLGLTFLSGYERGVLSISLGPDFEYLYEIEKDIFEGGDYWESGARIEVDLVSVGHFFGSVDNVLGYRDLKHDSDLQSSFTFERLSVIGDVGIWRGLSLSALFSAEWEWHENRTENVALFLLSSNLTYTF